MIAGIGIDIVDVARIEERLQKNIDLEKHIFHSAEVEYCKKQHSPFIHFAARFAVKEAFLKAFGVKFIGNHHLPEIEVVNDEFGKPSIVLHNKTLATYNEMKFSNMMISITHTKETAVAVVVLEK